MNSSSALLSQQIQQDAPFDLFFSANALFVDQLAASRKVLPESVRTYAVGRLGIVWRDGKKHPIRELSTMLVKFVALPNPKLAPYGVAAQQALEYAGLWSMVQSKVVYGENVRQTLQMVESGNADAAITADSLLQGTNADLIPDDWHQPIVQKAAIVAGTRNKERAQQFLDFVLSPAGQEILAKYGFSAPAGR